MSDYHHTSIISVPKKLAANARTTKCKRPFTPSGYETNGAKYCDNVMIGYESLYFFRIACNVCYGFFNITNIKYGYHMNKVELHICELKYKLTRHVSIHIYDHIKIIILTFESPLARQLGGKLQRSWVLCSLAFARCVYVCGCML